MGEGEGSISYLQILGVLVSYRRQALTQLHWRHTLSYRRTVREEGSSATCPLTGHERA
jgi:hypothetical protein